LLQAHNQKLDQAGFKASAITDDLGRAAAAAKLWSETLSVERWTQWLADWGIRGTGGVVFSVAGYISCPTLDPITMVVRTIVLFFGGKKILAGVATGEGFVQIRHLWTSTWIERFFSSARLFDSYTSEPKASIAEYPSMVSELFEARQTPLADMA
jgi:hypothetical protein